MTTTLVERLRKRAQAERDIQANNEAVAACLLPQLEAFEKRDGSHNTFAVRLYLEHRDCAKTDAELAADWDEAAALIERQEAVIASLAASLIECRAWLGPSGTGLRADAALAEAKTHVGE